MFLPVRTNRVILKEILKSSFILKRGIEQQRKTFHKVHYQVCAAHSQIKVREESTLIC